MHLFFSNRSISEFYDKISCTFAGFSSQWPFSHVKACIFAGFAPIIRAPIIRFETLKPDRLLVFVPAVPFSSVITCAFSKVKVTFLLKPSTYEKTHLTYEKNILFMWFRLFIIGLTEKASCATFNLFNSNMFSGYLGQVLHRGSGGYGGPGESLAPGKI